MLFGRYVDGVIEILTSEEFPIEYSFGPSYVFSVHDEETLQDRLKQPRIELDGASLELLGWWHSHTRSSIDLTEEDLRIHKQFFADDRTVALILKPFKLEPAQAAVYFPNATPDPFIAACQFSIGIPKAASPESKPSEHPVLERVSVAPVAELAPVKVEAVFIPPRKRRGCDQFGASDRNAVRIWAVGARFQNMVQRSAVSATTARIDVVTAGILNDGKRADFALGSEC